MSIDAFRDDPWGESHPTYRNSTFFHIQPAPEFATAEVMVSSLYRVSGFDVPEKGVSSAGREFARESGMPRLHEKSGSKVDMETWRVVINAVLESPKQPNQSSKRFLQMCPMVPDVALYSGSARLTGNSWNPGELAQRMIALGCETQAAADALWKALFDSLSVSDNDDIWARWLSQEFGLRRRNGAKWQLAARKRDEVIPASEKAGLSYPAKQFVRDIEGILRAKLYMTRRQWVSLLEAIVRLGSVSHVLWLCEVNYRVWHAIRAVIGGEAALDQNVARIVTCDSSFLTYGNPAVPIIRRYASRYLVSRIGINAVLWHLQLLGSDIRSIASCAELASFLKVVEEKRAELASANVEQLVADLQEGDKNARTIACKKGIGSNMVEFARHVLGQRQTAVETLRGYDQGYILRKKGDHQNAPWIVSMGPVSILALVHCCLRDAAGPRSIQKLCQHLAAYGIGVDRDDVTASDLGRKLRMLGLVLDSPDAESGMLLVPPFDGVARARHA